jgi:tetratricopeptide (TPR) repeat protein
MTQIDNNSFVRLERWDLAAVVSLALVCVGIYVNSLPNPMIRDDKTAVVDDVRARDPSHWRDIFTQRYWHGLNSDPIYRPIATLSFLLNRMATGPSPVGFRAFNIALHVAVCAAVYAVGLLLIRHRLAAWLAAMLFAVHAVHTEAVTAIVGRADLAVTLLLLAIVWLLLRRPDPGRCEGWRLVLVALLAALAMFWKESAFAALPLVVFIQIWQRWTFDPSAPGPEKRRNFTGRDLAVPLAVGGVCVAALAVRFALFGQVSRPARFVPIMDNPLGHASPTERLTTSIVLLAKYLRLLAWPHPLSCDYSYNQIPVARSLLETPVLIGLGWVAGIGLILWLVKRSGDRGGWRLAVWCTGFFAVTYSMISNAVLVIGTVFGERLIYLPSVAWCWAFGIAGVGLLRRPDRWVRLTAATLISLYLVANAVLTVRRNMDWRSPLVLWEQTVRVSPDSGRAWANLARTLGEAGRREEAVEKMRHALKINDEYWDDFMTLGDNLAWLGRFEEAAQAHLRAYQLADAPFKGRPARLLGQCCMELKQTDRAVRAFKAALDVDPNDVLSLNNLAYLQATASDPALRDLEGAATNIEKAMRIAPKSLILLDTAVDVYLARGQRERAIQLIRQGLSSGDPREQMYTSLEKRLKELTSTTGPSTTRTTTGQVR